MPPPHYNALTCFLSYWKGTFSNAYYLNRLFYIGEESFRLADFSMRSIKNGNDAVMKSLVRQVIRFRKARLTARHDSGSYYVVIPLYSGNKLEVFIGREQTIR